MKTYFVKVKVTFTGTVKVNAEHRDIARKLVNENFGGIIDHYGNNLQDEGIADWEMGIHSDTTQATKITLK